MDDRNEAPASVWARLRANRATNTRLFLEAGVRPELADDLTCPACGAEENAVFWSVARRSAGTLDLSCPVCARSQLRYDLASHRAIDPVFTRGSVGGGLGMVALLLVVGTAFYFRDTEPVQALVEDAWIARDALAGWTGRATGGLVGSDPAVAAAPSSARAGRHAPRPPRPPAASVPATGAAGRVDPGTPLGSAARAVVSSSPATAAPAAHVYRARGDRREDLDLVMARIIDDHGEPEAVLLLQAEYDAERDETRVVVDAASHEWPRRLSRSRGWRRVGS